MSASSGRTRTALPSQRTGPWVGVQRGSPGSGGVVDDTCEAVDEIRDDVIELRELMNDVQDVMHEL
jgi:hypothetical protein